MQDKSEYRGTVVVRPDGSLVLQHLPIDSAAPPATLVIDGHTYRLYRYELSKVSSVEFGFIASTNPPSVDDRHRAASQLFGEHAFGIERVTPVQTTSLIPPAGA